MHVLTYQRARRISGDPKSKQFWSSLETVLHTSIVAGHMDLGNNRELQCLWHACSMLPRFGRPRLRV